MAPGTAVVSNGTLFAGDTLAGGTFAYQDKHVGTGKTVMVSGVTVNDGNGGANYNVGYADNTASSISAASLTVSAAAVTKTYDGTTSAAGVPSVSSGTLFAGDTFSGGSFAFLDKDAGTNKTVTVAGVSIVDGNGGGNYVVSFVDNFTSTINPAGLAIGGIAATSRVYDGGTAASLTGSAVVTPFGSDAVSVTGTGVGSFADKHAGSGKPVNVTGFTLTGADAGNYLPLQPSVVANITPANLTLTTEAASRVYDGTTVAPGAAIVSNGTLFAGDTLTGGNFAYLDKHAGTGKTVTVGGVTVNDGNGGGNYAVSYVDNTSSSIVPAALTVSAAAVTKTYDGTTSAVGTPAVSSGTLFDGDTLSGGGFAFLDKNAGTNKTVTASGVTINDGNGGAQLRGQLCGQQQQHDHAGQSGGEQRSREQGL